MRFLPAALSRLSLNKRDLRQKDGEGQGKKNDGGTGRRGDGVRKIFSPSLPVSASPSHDSFHRCRHSALRFSMKALTPSRASSDLISSCRYRFSTPASVESNDAAPRSIALRAISRATDESSLILSRISCVFRSSSAPGTT